MYKITHAYKDFDGNQREKTLYFHITEAEALKLEMKLAGEGGLKAIAEKIVETKDFDKMCDLFTRLIDMSYGIKSADGDTFEKSEEILHKFKSTQAYSDLYVKFATDDVAAAEFFNGILPTDLRERAEQAAKESKKDSDVIEGKFTPVN